MTTRLIFMFLFALAWAERAMAFEIFTPYTIKTLAAPGSYAPPSYRAVPNGIAVDAWGDVYFSDIWSNRLIYMLPPGGQVSVVAGGASTATDGTNAAAGFGSPTSIAIDSSTNLYVADTGSSAIRKVAKSGTNWVVMTLAGGPGSPLPSVGSADGTNLTATFDQPNGIAVDSAGALYVADTGNRTIRKLVQSGMNWITTTIAGEAGQPVQFRDGTNGAARFVYPSAIAIDKHGILYVLDNNEVREVSPNGTNWVVTTLFVPHNENDGTVNGTNSIAPITVGASSGIVVDGAGNIYTSANYSIQRVTPSGTDWIGTTLISGGGRLVDGTGAQGWVNRPTGIAVDPIGNLYIADTGNYAVRVASPALLYTVTNNQFVFSWPTTPPGGYRLESSTSLSPGAVWNPVTDGIVTNGVDFVATNQIDTNIGGIFFRIAPQQ